MWSLLEFFPEDFRIGILDIGAALLERPPYQSLLEAGRCVIHGFEPDMEACDKLARTYGPPHRIFPYFAGNGEAATFHETNWGATGSLFEPNTPVLEKFQNLAELVTPKARHAVMTTRIDDIDEIGDIDLIKIDVQGAELQVLGSARRALSGALVVQAEVEFLEVYKGQPLFGDVDRFLRQAGFQFHTFEGFGSRTFKPMILNQDVNLGMRQLIWSDATYVRDWMQLDALDPMKLRKYAVLAHDVVRSYDLAHMVLAALDQRTGTLLAPRYMQRLAEEGLPAS
jgi:FkbM family methyltransferase